MGVPAFFRWLSRKYPSIVVHCVEDKAKNVGGHEIPVDASLPNPNEVEFDNLYLDMNGIIHPCCHPEDRPAPENEDEMMLAIFEYIDRIFNLVRPRKLLYMAIDGVAPRAKMNQQRSRRFRSAKESLEKLEDIKRIREELRERGCELPPLKPDSEHFDSNCITPGTEFMARLSDCLAYYIHDRMNSVPAWKSIKVILSDANVPGEGEHKIMDYIRKQRASPDHDPNTHHCLCGADADLIMLGLATHEPYFTILREEFKPNTPRPCEICNQIGHSMKECTGEVREKRGKFDELDPVNIGAQKDFIFIRITVLREYLHRDLKMHGTNFTYDFERAIDDWVFMCFFVGNDFLPHLPSLQIREGAIDRLINLYKDVITISGGYLTHNGMVDVKRVKLILLELGKVEDEIFRNRRERDLMEKERRKFQKDRVEQYKRPRFIPQQLEPVPITSDPAPAFGARRDAYNMRLSQTLVDNQEAAKSLKSMLKNPQGQRRSLDGGDSSSSQDQDAVDGRRSWKNEQKSEQERMQRKRKLDTEKEKVSASSDGETTEDDIRLWEEGWKKRYYETKFDASCEDSDFVGQVVESYMEGLCWVMAYYYQGCSSWKWFYPFHYAPFASDFKYASTALNLYKFEEDTRPFKPLEQLMGVFPAASCKFLPPAWQELMLANDSPVIDFYPCNFKVDLNGKKFAWQGVALLPFVNERRLLSALDEVYNTLTEEESVRNSLGCDYIFMHNSSKLYSFVRTLYEDDMHTNRIDEQPVNEGVKMNPELSGRISGEFWVSKKMRNVILNNWTVVSPISGLKDICHTSVISGNFRDPYFPKGFRFQAKLLEGVILPSPSLKPENFGPGQYTPQTGFGRRHQRSYSTPEAAGRMIRHTVGDGRQHDHRRSGDSWSPHGTYPGSGRGRSDSRLSWSPHGNHPDSGWGRNDPRSSLSPHGTYPNSGRGRNDPRSSWSPHGAYPNSRRGRSDSHSSRQSYDHYNQPYNSEGNNSGNRWTPLPPPSPTAGSHPTSAQYDQSPQHHHMYQPHYQPLQNQDMQHYQHHRQ